MKMLSAILMLILSMSSFASSVTKTFFYDGSQDSISMVLRAEKTHTEYRYEQRRSICYRQDVFYRNVCHRSPQGGQICQTIPEYRTTSYPCMETVRVGFEVKDYDVEANVDLNVAPITSTLAAAETFKVTLNGDMLSVSAAGSKRYFILMKKAEVQSQMSGSVKFVNGSYTAELVEAAPVVRALEMTNISLQDSVLNFKIGPVAAREHIGFHLNVKKAPLLGSDTVIFDRDLAASETQLNVLEASSSVNVNIHNLGIQLASGRHLLTATAFFKHAGTIINVSDFERTEAGRTLIYKVR
jgi:hypothetical protein